MRLMALLLWGFISILPSLDSKGAESKEKGSDNSTLDETGSLVYVIPVQDEISGKQEVFQNPV